MNNIKNALENVLRSQLLENVDSELYPENCLNCNTKLSPDNNWTQSLYFCSNYCCREHAKKEREKNFKIKLKMVGIEI
jgi:hypothetical protein